MGQKDGSINLRGIVVERGALGEHITIDPRGAIFHKEVPVSLNFEKHIGSARLHYEDKIGIVADMKIEDVGILSHHFYPSVGGVIEASHEENGIRYIDKFKLTSVGISFIKNEDPLIKSLKEQNEETKLID